MPELSLKERLQPALLDRLIDEERLITVVTVTVREEELSRLLMVPEELQSILRAQGLRPTSDEKTSVDGVITWQFVATARAPGPAQLKALTITPPGAPTGVSLQQFCTIDVVTRPNEQPDPGAASMISMRRLRESVQRDLTWLLNSADLHSLQDLSRYPHVARSVVNYGMPSLAGRAVSSMDPQAIAHRIREAVTLFEPRLTRVQVLPDRRDKREEITLSFRIEAELWGHPAPQHLVLHTSIDVETGDVRVSESG